MLNFNHFLRNEINRWLVMLTPFLMLLLNLIYSLKLQDSLSFPAKMILANFISFGFFTNIIFTYYAFRLKFCNFSKIAILGLHLLTILNLIYYGTDLINGEEYYRYYDLLILTISLSLSLFFLIVKLINNFHIIKEHMKEIVEFVKVSIYIIFAYLKIDMEVFSILMTFMLLDSIFGAIKSVRLGRRFKFKILLWGFVTKIGFLIIPLLVALLGKGLNYDLTISVQIVMKILIVAEAYSVFGNIYAAKNRKEVEELDIISMLLKSIRIGLKKILNSALQEIERGSDCNTGECDKTYDNIDEPKDEQDV